MKKKVLSYIIDNNLIKSGDKILVALSGGPDSLCLLNILKELREELDIEIGAAHLNHLLRGEDAFKDEEFVISTCKEMNIPYYVKRVDINKYSKEHKLSSELAGRNVRYGFFDEILKKDGFNKIATAHNANDQAETIIFRLMRGTGLEGLGGIKVCREDKIIRPILCLTRKEVEKYIKEKNLNPRIDKTNFEKIYNRNKIRLDIIPYIQNNFNEDIVKTLNRMSLLIQKDNAFIERLCIKAYNEYCKKNTDSKFYILKKELFKEDQAIVTRIIRTALIEYSKSHYDFEMKHIYDILELSKKETGKGINLPKNIYVENIYGDIKISSNMKKDIKVDKTEFLLNRKSIGEDRVQFNNYEFEISVLKNKSNNLIDLKENKLVKYFDLDKISENILFRTRKNGDKITPLGMKGQKKLKDIFINMKVPKEERDSIPVICFDDDIAWILGLQISDNFKVTNNSKNILKIVAERKE
ncbi:tRNA lysidine(34) synthetase TilS [Clostridium botulinum]|uniref:tRNA(Ile)-lysidine synthase n=1 Tax=Clostridium botulinum TaxID=1491 RepID=A0A6B4JPF0_CLOBO|nr:tRNA lysidine(34) synthetase TilS [Clostridium botulinum]EES49495.1 tRNA(Ile)-lysidine synthase [Clostridium botulinum E1 str. 'BoNT E Beluga']MBY6762283.1 tRNA lysidine(34) synthetase TilS [Clostridium botulinum]MBY6921126.1 tRNA lysidine(34) synthetase TilS [Clostridium botulinum]MCR1132017.1 tRNA lysidine(34) synthetase TilS [Clostridium botulinum]NFH69315.1 tRNA lysidine(34) synthetase TilS [Clostridium botulinum]